jgi:hypothetical protein
LNSDFRIKRALHPKSIVDKPAASPHTVNMGPHSGLNPIISQLRDHLGLRRMECGMHTLAAHALALESLDPAAPNAGILLGLVAQWVDAGFARPRTGARLTRSLPLRVPRGTSLARLPPRAHGRRHGGDGLRRFRARRPSTSASFNPWKAKLTTSNFSPSPISGPARCLRHIGRYDDALGFATKGRRLALDFGYAPMAAIVQVLESWLAFQKGKLNESVRLLAGSRVRAERYRRFRHPRQHTIRLRPHRPPPGSATKPPSNTSTAPSPNINAAIPSTCTSRAPWSILRW